MMSRTFRFFKHEIKRSIEPASWFYPYIWNDDGTVDVERYYDYMDWELDWRISMLRDGVHRQHGSAPRWFRNTHNRIERRRNKLQCRQFLLDPESYDDAILTGHSSEYYWDWHL